MVLLVRLAGRYSSRGAVVVVAAAAQQRLVSSTLVHTSDVAMSLSDRIRNSHHQVRQSSSTVDHDHHHDHYETNTATTAAAVAQATHLFDTWNAALATGHPDTVAALYTPNAVLLPTVSDTPRTTPDLIRDYFVHFLQHQPHGTILERHVHHGVANCLMDVGLYHFTMRSNNTEVTARYSFVYEKDDTGCGWKIAHHHSSILPEAALAALAHQEKQPQPSSSS